MPTKIIPLFVKKSELHKYKTPMTPTPSIITPIALPSVTPTVSITPPPASITPPASIALPASITPSITQLPPAPTVSITPPAAPLAPPTTDDALGMVTLSQEQKEELLDKLETKKYELEQERRYKPDVSQQDYDDVKRLIALLKTCTNQERISINVTNKKQIESNFVRTITSNEFARIIDLTAPKAEREPDINTSIWDKSKNAVFKNSKYSQATDDKLKKFQDRLRPKPMPSQLQEDLKSKIDQNLLSTKNSAGYGVYDPFTHKGINAF